MLDVIVKFDGVESPNCAYNEIVSLRIARLLGVPVAEGALATIAGRLVFASLKISGPGWIRMDLSKPAVPALAKRYPDEIAAIAVFDIFVGNIDRGGNFAASVRTPHLPLLVAYDHSHCLLDSRQSARQSLQALGRGDLLADVHPFYGHIQPRYLRKWLDRVDSISGERLFECCQLGMPAGPATMALQQSLGRALVRRMRRLRSIVDHHYVRIVMPSAS